MGGAREESHTFLKGTFLVNPLNTCLPIITKKFDLKLSVECLKVLLIFYLMPLLHKKVRQSLRHSTESFRSDFLMIIGTHIVKGLTKNVPLRKV